MAQKIVQNPALSNLVSNLHAANKELQALTLQVEEMKAIVGQEARKMFEQDLIRGEAITTYKIPVLDKAGNETGEFVQYQVKTSSSVIDKPTYEQFVDMFGALAPSIVGTVTGITQITDTPELLDSLADVQGLVVTTNAGGDLVVKMKGVDLDTLRGIKTAEAHTLESGLLDKVADELPKIPEAVPLIRQAVTQNAKPQIVIGTTAKQK